MSHTSGPWQREDSTIYSSMHHGWQKGVEIFRNRFTCIVQRDSCVGDEEHEANARLIAAAPELLEALEPFAKFAEHWDARPPGGLARNDEDEVYTIHLIPGGPPASITLGHLRAARAVIRKARGE